MAEFQGFTGRFNALTLLRELLMFFGAENVIFFFGFAIISEL
jgi:hypothetical protein